MSLNLHAVTSGNPQDSSIIILHGLFGSSSNWRSIAKSLSTKFYVHSLDLRNHGQSPWDDSMTYLDMAADVERYIVDNKIHCPHVIGHSMGGKTAMTLAQSFDLDLGKIAIIDIAPVDYEHDHDRLLDALMLLDLRKVDSRGAADNALSASIEELTIRQFLLQNLVRSDDGYRWRINLDAIAKNRAAIFSYPRALAINKQLLFIRGENSDYIQNNHEAEIHSKFPYASIKTIAAAGHWLHAEQPARLLGMVYQYFES